MGDETVDEATKTIGERAVQLVLKHEWSASENDLAGCPYPICPECRSPEYGFKRADGIDAVHSAGCAWGELCDVAKRLRLGQAAEGIA